MYKNRIRGLERRTSGALTTKSVSISCLLESLTHFVFSARSCDVASEDAEFARGIAHLGEGLVEAGRVFGFEVNEKLIFPGTAVNRAALDFEQVHSVLRKRLEGSKQGAGAMRESHGQGSFAGPGRLPGPSLLARHQENETREIFGVVLLGISYCMR